MLTVVQLALDTVLAASSAVPCKESSAVCWHGATSMHTGCEHLQLISPCCKGGRNVEGVSPSRGVKFLPNLLSTPLPTSAATVAACVYDTKVRWGQYGTVPT